ncbi:hypothetical protein LK837_004946 [Salmonella enterica]|nr:hypothetical protein [Salmonella enterica]
MKTAIEWESPTCTEVREVIRLTGLSGSAVARELGLKDSRNLRNWQMLKTPDAKSSIPYAAWALLCFYAGLGMIFEKSSENEA